MTAPCGGCLGCRLDSARGWAIRCMHTALSYPREDACFLTLTYNQKNLPIDRQLQRDAMPAFFKRLRENLSYKPLSYLYCGEYGDATMRPHYHAILFGHAFRDHLRAYKKTKLGHWLFNSPELDDAWQQGHAVIGGVSFQSAGYVGRYVLKKQTGEGNPQGNTFCSEIETGEALTVSQYLARHKIPPFAEPSNRPSLGKLWLEKYLSDVYPHDYVLMEGRKMRPPRYYDKILERVDPKTFSLVKSARRKNARNFEHDRDEDRNFHGELLAKRAQVDRLVRNLDY